MLLFDLPHPTLRLGVVRAERVRFSPSSVTLLARLAHAESSVRANPALFPERVRTQVRDVLRVGGYKPTGRGKPASELLLAFAHKAPLTEENEPALPRIGNLVEINNVVSLETALPISIFDAARLGPSPTIRFGRPDETYVFNQSGHAMDLEGLPVVCRSADDTPIGNAVRDSMLGKVDATTTSVLVVVYSARALGDEILQRAIDDLSALLRDEAEGAGITSAIVPVRT